jgi:hypothetical protein
MVEASDGVEGDATKCRDPGHGCKMRHPTRRADARHPRRRAPEIEREDVVTREAAPRRPHALARREGDVGLRSRPYRIARREPRHAPRRAHQHEPTVRCGDEAPIRPRSRDVHDPRT